MAAEPYDVPAKGDEKRGRWHKPAGVLLEVIGLFWLAKKAGWMPVEQTHAAIFWPLVLTAIGVFIFFHAGQKNRHRA